MSNRKLLLENHGGKVRQIIWIAREQLTRHLEKMVGVPQERR
jgi:hypothetical protein